MPEAELTPPEGMAAFWRFIRRFLFLVSAGTAATALVLVSWLLKIAPPWPKAMLEITAVAQLVALVLVYSFSSNVSRARANRRMIIATLMLCVGFIAYVAWFSLVVFKSGDATYDVKGLICVSDIPKEFLNSCPFLSDKALADADYQAETLWTAIGLMISRTLLLTGWLFSFGCLVTVLGTFAARMDGKEKKSIVK